MAKRKDAAASKAGSEKEKSAGPLTNGTAEPAAKEQAPAKASISADAKADAKAAMNDVADTAAKVAKDVAAAAKDAKDKAADVAAQTAAATKQQAQKAATAVRSRSPTDVALVLSVMNSVVLLALISGLGSAAYLARTGQLETVLSTFAFGGAGGSAGSQGFFALSATDIDGAHVSLSRYAGRLTIVANVASEDHVHRYSQTNYERLNYLYSKYHERGLEILAFPCSQFGGLEPGGDAEIKAKVRATYNATFPLFSKVDVKGPGAHPVWRFLMQNQPKDHGYPDAVDWNFNKFVVSKSGWPLVRYPLTFDDEDLEGIEGWITANI